MCIRTSGELLLARSWNAYENMIFLEMPMLQRSLKNDCWPSAAKFHP